MYIACNIQYKTSLQTEYSKTLGGNNEKLMGVIGEGGEYKNEDNLPGSVPINKRCWNIILGV